MIVTASDGTRLHVLDQGKGDAVLWLQGLNAPAAAWAVQLAHFGQTVRSIAPDGRGVGQSDAPPPPYTTRQLGDDALAVLDAMQVERAHVVGLSLGGAAAQELALAHPERVRSLALLSTFAAQGPRTRALLQAWRVLYPLVAREPGPELRAAWERQADPRRARPARAPRRRRRAGPPHPRRGADRHSRRRARGEPRGTAGGPRRFADVVEARALM